MFCFVLLQSFRKWVQYASGCLATWMNQSSCDNELVFLLLSWVNETYATKHRLTVMMFTLLFSACICKPSTVCIASLVSILHWKHWARLLKWRERWHRRNVNHWLRPTQTCHWRTYLQMGDEINNGDKLWFRTQSRGELIVRLVFSFPPRHNKLSTLD